MPRTSISLLAAHAKMTPCSRFDAMPISSQINTSTAGAVSCSIALTKLAAVRTCTPVAAPKFCAANPAVEIPKTFNPLASHTYRAASADAVFPVPAAPTTKSTWLPPHTQRKNMSR